MIHIDGFEQFKDEGKMAAALTRADYVNNGQWTPVAGRGTFSTALATQKASLARVHPWTGVKFACGFAHNFSARGSVAWLTIGATVVTLWMNPDTGLPTLGDSPGGALPTINRWYYFELEIDRSAATLTLRINNRVDSFISLPGAAMTATEVTLAIGYRTPADYRPGVTPVPVDNGTKNYDDFYMRDGEARGPIMVTTRFPSVDKNAEWFVASTSGINHSATLSLRPPDPLDNYVASDTIGKEDRFTSAQPLANENDVLATGVMVLARKAPTLNAKLGVFIDGTAPARADTRTVESEWRTQFVCFEENGSDTPSNITTSDFGINVSAP